MVPVHAEDLGVNVPTGTLAAEGTEPCARNQCSITVVEDDLASESLAFYLRFPPNLLCAIELREELPPDACKWDERAGAWLIDGDHILPAERIVQRYFRPQTTMTIYPCNPWATLELPPNSPLWAARSAYQRILEMHGDHLQHCKNVELAFEMIESMYLGGRGDDNAGF